MSEIAARLNELLEEAGEAPLSHEQGARFSAYYDLLTRWNARLNLTAIRTPEEILRRHFVECIVCARLLPAGVSTLLDYGSGAGLPGIPVALLRPEIQVTLAESQARKAAFLREAVRTVPVTAEVYGGRVEAMPPEQRFGAVALRAVDKMHEAVCAAADRLESRGILMLMITGSEIDSYRAMLPEISWWELVKVPDSADRVVLLGRIEEVIPRGTTPEASPKRA